ncbi:MAG: hypothetical protein ABI884_12575 [Gemmatimonadota bacterium]
MSRPAVARIIAITIVGYLFALLAVSGAKTNIEHYRSLSHDALLAELQKGERGFDKTFVVTILVMGGFVLIIDGLSWLVLQAMNGISPPPPPEPAPEESTGPTLRFH